MLRMTECGLRARFAAGFRHAERVAYGRGIVGRGMKKRADPRIPHSPTQERRRRNTEARRALRRRAFCDFYVR